jgi:hypothetical protein
MGATMTIAANSTALPDNIAIDRLRARPLWLRRSSMDIDQDFRDRALALPVALDDRRLEGLRPTLRHLTATPAGSVLARSRRLLRAELVALICARNALRPLHIGRRLARCNKWFAVIESACKTSLAQHTF